MAAVKLFVTKISVRAAKGAKEKQAGGSMGKDEQALH
jgi:hypothetical protein